MIQNDHELAVMRARAAKLEGLLEALRKTARPPVCCVRTGREEWSALSSGYRHEIERMQGEILDDPVQGATPAAPGRQELEWA